MCGQERGCGGGWFQTSGGLDVCPSRPPPRVPFPEATFLPPNSKLTQPQEIRGVRRGEGRPGQATLGPRRAGPGPGDTAQPQRTLEWPWEVPRPGRDAEQRRWLRRLPWWWRKRPRGSQGPRGCVPSIVRPTHGGSAACPPPSAPRRAGLALQELQPRARVPGSLLRSPIPGSSLEGLGVLSSHLPPLPWSPGFQVPGTSPGRQSWLEARGHLTGPPGPIPLSAQPRSLPLKKKKNY